MLTVAGQVVLAEEARAARNRKRHNDAITALKLGNAAPCFLDDSHELVPERHRPRLRKKPVVNVQVRAADRGGRDAQNHVVRFLDRRVRNGIDGDFAGCVENECFHSDGTIELAVELRRRRKAAFAFRTPAFRSVGEEFLRLLRFVFVLFLVRCGGIGVHCRFGEFGELRVGFLFLIERFLEEIGEIVVTEASRESAGGAVAGDFVMLDALRRADETGIANALFRIFIDQLRALFYQAFHGFACVPGELFAKLLADLRESLDVPFGLLEVFFEAGFEFWICRGFRHLRERFDELVFSAVEVFEFVKEEIF